MSESLQETMRAWNPRFWSVARKTIESISVRNPGIQSWCKRFCMGCPLLFAMKILPVRNLLKGSMNRFLFGQSFFAKYFVRFFQVRREFHLDFILLLSIKGEAGETLADKLLPIRHATPLLASSTHQRVPPIPSGGATVSSSRQE